MENKEIAVLIPCYNESKTIAKVIKDYKKALPEAKIYVYDNNSTDGTKEWLKDQKDLKIIYNKENVGFPKGCNQGISITNKKNDILLLNNDTIVTENWLKNLKICLESKANIGAVGSVCNQNGNKQGVDFTYENFDEMQLLAKKNNQSNFQKWEEKV